MAEKEFLEYKGRPLVRKGDEIYYGNSSEKFVIAMRVLTNKTVGGEEIADKIAIQLLATDATLPPQERIVKTSEKNGLYNALDIASIWLERALKKQ